MRTAPKTPKAGSSFVSRTIGSGVADADSEGVVEVLEAEPDSVILTLTVVGTTVVTENTRSLEVVAVVIVAEPVLSETETLGVGVGV